MSDDVESRVLRSKFKAFLKVRGYSENTANTFAYNVFFLWKRRGKESFWNTVHGDEQALRTTIRETLESFSPNRVNELSGFMTSFRLFRAFIEVVDSIPSADGQEQEQKAKQSNAYPPLLSLSAEKLEEEHQIVLNDPGYGTDYALINSVLKRFPDNTDVELVAMKIALIDMTYSTNIGRHRNRILLTELAGIIVNTADFDTRLRQGDPSLIPIIARCNGHINLFSFASKYCALHSVDVYGNDDYVIFDSVVKNALPKYVPGLHKSTIERWRSTYDYISFKNCIDELLDANDIHIPFRHRKLDHFLWHTYK